ncbi:hypothetical protein [Phenylobacterium sp.]|uniref:hypothetical protein n=1 Tax=Phenylobacterium sp. TaxID=1871053 RepID=UPI002F3F1EA3
MAARPLSTSVRLLAAAALCALSAAACAPALGPPPPGRLPSAPPPPPPPADDAFRASDFAWSQVPGKNTLSGVLAHPPGAARYTCAGLTVVATPETPWSRRRMMVLYKSDQRAALPVDDVRSRQNMAPPGDSDPYVKRAKCDAANHFVFPGLPDGAWYLVTLAKPAAGQSGPNLAMMRRVVTKGGKVTPFEL